jgi:TRAP-type C4-dicarboxylate transport system permease small subunit
VSASGDALPGVAGDAGATAAARAPFTRVARSFVARLDASLEVVNRAVSVVCMTAMIVAGGVLTYSVVARYFLRSATDWQDETAAFLLVGATFMSAAFVQSRRGHVAIEVLAPLLSPRLNRARLFLVDVISLWFCAFFAWKSWTLFHEAWVDGQTSNSSFGPPLWIPYVLMALGMLLRAITHDKQ